MPQILITTRQRCKCRDLPVGLFIDFPIFWPSDSDSQSFLSEITSKILILMEPRNGSGNYYSLLTCGERLYTSEGQTYKPCRSVAFRSILHPPTHNLMWTSTESDEIINFSNLFLLISCREWSLVLKIIDSSIIYLGDWDSGQHTADDDDDDAVIWTRF